MTSLDRELGRSRAGAGVAVAALHALLAYALVTGLGVEVVHAVSERLKTFDVVIPPPPPPEPPIPPQARSRDPEGAAAPPSLKARPTPVVAPPPRIRVKARPPLPSAPKALPLPTGRDRTAGSSDVPGTGTGAGGQGTGAGSGGSGSGTGGGGQAARARRLTGAFTEADYRRVSKGRQLRGTVHVRYTVATDGRAGQCAVTRSSGSSELDSETCRIIEQRFRYRPATDASGKPVADRVSTSFSWEPR